MKIDVFTVSLFEEETVGSTLGAKQVALFHNRFSVVQLPNPSANMVIFSLKPIRLMVTASRRNR
jgi:hypothetical protein